MTYIIHADYQPLNYIISGIDSSQIKEICLKDIKDTLLLRCVRGLLRRLGLYWFSAACILEVNPWNNFRLSKKMQE